MAYELNTLLCTLQEMSLARAESMRADLASRPRPVSGDGSAECLDDQPPSGHLHSILPPIADLSSERLGHLDPGIATPAELSTVPPWNLPPDEQDGGGLVPVPLDGSSTLPTWPESWMDLEDLLERLTSGTTFGPESRSIDDEGFDLLQADIR